MSTLQKTALVLTLVGALNWGLIGLFGFDLIAFIFGGATTFLSRTFYSIVGVAAIINLTLLAYPMKDY